MDIATAIFLVPRLKYLRNNLFGNPSDLTFEEWQNKLDEMIFAFEFVLKEDDYLMQCYPADYNWGFTTDKDGILQNNDKRKPDYTEYNKLEERYNKGMELFKVYFRHLWD
ncbi:MAG: hypothetical protein AABY22_03675 [Nanoarchaeota archaeon]